MSIVLDNGCSPNHAFNRGYWDVLVTKHIQCAKDKFPHGKKYVLSFNI